MRVVFRARGFGHFVSLFNQGRQQRFVRLLPIPWATAGRAQFRDDFAELREGGHSEWSVAESKNPVAPPFSFNTGFLDFARNDIRSNPPQRALRTELGDFAGGSFTEINRN